MTPPRDDDPVLGIVYELSLESRAYVGGRLGAEAYMTYIGQSCRRGYETPEQLLQQRWDEHVERRDVISPKKRQRRLLARAITRYGHSQFKKRVLHTTRGRRKIVKEWADAVEADLIDQRGTLNTNRGNRKRSAATEEEEATVSRGGKRARTTQREKGERPRDRGGTDGGQRARKRSREETEGEAKRRRRSERPKRANGRLTAEERGRLWDALGEQGVSLRQIAARFGISNQAVSSWKARRDQGWTRDDFEAGGDSNKRLTAEERGRLWDALGEQGVSQNQIAARFGIVNQTVSSWKVRREQGWTRDDSVAGGDSNKRLTAEERGRLWDALGEQGASLRQIAARFGIVNQTVSSWKVRRDQGWTRDDFVSGGDRNKRLTAEERGRLWDALDEQGASLRQIAARFGIARATVSKWKAKREQG